MKLEIQNFEIRDVQLSDKTGYSRGVLSIHKKELLNLLSEDKRIKALDIQVACPG